MKRVLEWGVNEQWGLFSKAIPGRVGYVCSNQWTKMIKNGAVKDLNRYKNAEGKWKFHRKPKNSQISDEFRKYAFTIVKDSSGTFKRCPQRHPKHPSDDYCKRILEELKANTVGGHKKRKRNGDEDEDFTVAKKKRKRNKKNKNRNDSDDDGAFHCNVGVDVPVDDDNPMPDFKDIITGDCVIKPTMSPYGHVLSYDTWTKILRTSKQKNVCPFTCQKLTRRSLIKLTKENYAEYKGQIRNISQEQMDLYGTMTG